MIARLALGVGLALVCAAPSLAGTDIDFATQVRPLLAARCYACHGPDEETSGLRLDLVGRALEGGYSGPAILPGKSAASLMIQAVRGEADIPRMPPEGDPLAPEEIELLAAWIDQGAHAPNENEVLANARKSSTHWAFQPLATVEPPSQLSKPDWVRNPIDSFVLGRLDAAALEPSIEADRTTLIRRVSLDLLGLPPTPPEVEAFVNDSSPDAYESLVDRLLDSPHYGERWGRHWLDAARYADSNGYTIDSGRSIWKYRDWVIAAHNRDLPFDQFAIEQVAGDMLPNATLDQRIATGFHRNTLKNEEGGTDPEQFRVESVVDRISTTGSVFLGLTLGCARCHDHKYDPISQREFYQFFALFNNADEPILPVPTDQQAKEEPALLADIAQVQKRLNDTDANSGSRQAEWERKVRENLQVNWHPLAAVSAEATGGPPAELLADGCVQIREPGATQLVLSFQAPDPPTTAVRVEISAGVPMDGQSPTPSGSDVQVVLNELTLQYSANADGAETPHGGETMSVTLLRACAPDASEPDAVAPAVDGQPETGWSFAVPLAGQAPVAFVLVFAEATPLPVGAVATLRLSFGGEGISAGQLRLARSCDLRESAALSTRARTAVSQPAEERSAEEQELVLGEFRRVDRERLPLAASLNELLARQRQLATATTTSLVMQERSQPRDTKIHIRGDFLRPGARVSPAVPAVLPPLIAADGTPDRLDLARWLVAADNPLTPRVTVNRIWQQYFGQGFVDTENDFGAQGSLPTHPELLDWLSGELIKGGWSLKHVHRLIVRSATYRQASTFRDDIAEKDPYNRLLARQNRLRLEAEVIRDVALAAAGLLSREVGGPSVYPPQPEGVYRFTQQVKYWVDSPGADRYRRGMYTYFWRSSPHPFLKTFDAPDANVTCTRRNRSNTPLQALTLANDRQFVEAAQALARRVIREAPATDDARTDYAFRLCLARRPEKSELDRLTSFVRSQRAAFDQAPADAVQAAGAPAVAQPAAVELASWMNAARVLINLDEFVNRN